MFFIIILMVPLVCSTVTIFGDIDDPFELSENFNEEEGNDERESEEDKEIDDFQITRIQQASIFSNELNGTEFQSRNRKINKRSKDVLVPPPDFV